MADTRFFSNAGPFTLEELAGIANVSIESATDISLLVHDLAPLDQATEGTLTFLSNTKYAGQLKSTKASVCIVHPDFINDAPEGVALLVTQDPYGAYALIANVFYPQDSAIAGIDPAAAIASDAVIGRGCQIDAGAVIASKAEIGENCHIAANASIGKGVIVGSGSYIGANVTLSHTILGERCILHAGVSIGQDGFGFATIAGKHIKIPQLGRVIIGNDVEVGANTTIDRGAGPDTVIGEGTKIDNLVQIGHNVKMGRGCIIVAQTGISGSTVLGDYVVVGGQTGIAGHLSVGSGSQLAARSGVMNNVPAQSTYGGAPAIPIRDWHRQSVALRRLAKNTSTK